MKSHSIDFLDHLPKTIEDQMRKDLVAYEGGHGVDVNYHPFVLVLRDEHSKAIGVLNAYTAFAEVYINDMWVEKSQRGKGYGKKLILALENHFKGKGFNNMNLVTSSFNSPAFYEKCGFTAEFVRINHKNPQFTKTFFVKFFDDEVQTQGLLRK